MTLILDASVLLAFLHDEPEANRVQRVLEVAVVAWMERSGIRDREAFEPWLPRIPLRCIQATKKSL